MEHLSGTQFIGRLLTLLVNIRLGWEGLIEINTLARVFAPFMDRSSKYNICVQGQEPKERVWYLKVLHLGVHGTLLTNIRLG